MTNILCQIESARKVLLSGNQPSEGKFMDFSKFKLQGPFIGFVSIRMPCKCHVLSPFSCGMQMVTAEANKEIACTMDAG